MTTNQPQTFITTIKDRCRVCYTCVRECPAKAIRITDGQAEVIAERCIGCGNCVRVCSQNAKQVLSAIPNVDALLNSKKQVAALVAPSFPAEFTDFEIDQFVGLLRTLGFKYVIEVAAGADLVAKNMRDLLNEFPDRRFISSPCPAVFGFIKRYHPEIINEVAPVVSPMIATAILTHAKYGKDIATVFIGPCISKKIEANTDEVKDDIDEVITFEELRIMIKEKEINLSQITPSDFDPPHAGKGALFPVGRGFLEAADIQEDLIKDEVISANGKSNFVNAILDFSTGDLNARFLDVLCCDGCIMGSGMTTSDTLFKRRANISHYLREVVQKRDPKEWQAWMEEYKDLDLRRTFLPFDQRITTPDPDEIREVLKKMGKTRPEDELNCGACGYETCIDHAIAICKGLAEPEMCLPHSIEQLHKTVDKLNISNEQLATAKEALIQSEKLASMGQLSAGIAHEVNNPLGVILMYAHLLKESADPESEDFEDLQMIVDHADRAKKIVSGLLHFARQNKISFKKVDIEELVQDCIKSVEIPEHVKVSLTSETKNNFAEIDRDQMMQVLVNCISNGITAMPDGGTMTITINGSPNEITITIQDTGLGIPKSLKNKIFEPFFTTKEAGKGTGLGLAITYGIVKMHRGQIDVTSSTKEESDSPGTTFKISLPRVAQALNQSNNIKA